MNKRHAKEPTIGELAAIPGNAIDTNDIAPLDEAFWRNAKLVELAAPPQAALERGKPGNTPPIP